MHQPLRRRSILCLESDAESRELLSHALIDHELVFVDSAFETIRNMHARPFDGYVLEYWLPDWSGPQLCREIRKVDPHGPIIFCTAAAREVGIKRATRAGGNAYLCKPIDPAVLKAKLRVLFSAADDASLRAKAAMEQTVEDEVDRRVASAAEKIFAAHDALARSVERTARARAHKTFIESGGTRANFEHWWPQVFGSAWANSARAQA